MVDDGIRITRAIYELVIAFKEAGMQPPQSIILANEKELDRLVWSMSEYWKLDKPTANPSRVGEVKIYDVAIESADSIRDRASPRSPQPATVPQTHD